VRVALDVAQQLDDGADGNLLLVTIRSVSDPHRDPIRRIAELAARPEPPVRNRPAWSLEVDDHVLSYRGLGPLVVDRVVPPDDAGEVVVFFHTGLAVALNYLTPLRVAR
jgi:hypothetical protein